jgi:hypothetical protein
MTGGQGFRGKARGRLGARRDQPWNNVRLGHVLGEDGDAPSKRLVNQRIAIEVQGIEEHRRDRNFRAQRIIVQLASEAAHRVLKRTRRAVGPQRDRLAVEHDLARRNRPDDSHDFGHRNRDVPQCPRIDAHLVVDLVHLNTRAIELVFERRLAERGERLVDARCGFGEHRLNRLERAQQKLRQLGVAIDDGGVRDGSEIARQHAGAPDPRGRNARRARDGLDQHPLERALSELAEQQAHEEVLLVGRRPAEQPAQDLGAGTRGSGASRSRQTIECAIDVRDLEVGRGRGRHVAHGRQLGAADADPAPGARRRSKTR